MPAGGPRRPSSRSPRSRACRACSSTAASFARDHPASPRRYSASRRRKAGTARRPCKPWASPARRHPGSSGRCWHGAETIGSMLRLAPSTGAYEVAFLSAGKAAHSNTQAVEETAWAWVARPRAYTEATFPRGGQRESPVEKRGAAEGLGHNPGHTPLLGSKGVFLCIPQCSSHSFCHASD